MGRRFLGKPTPNHILRELRRPIDPEIIEVGNAHITLIREQLAESRRQKEETPPTEQWLEEKASEDTTASELRRAREQQDSVRISRERTALRYRSTGKVVIGSAIMDWDEQSSLYPERYYIGPDHTL